MPEAVCEVCGDEYDKAFEIVAAGETHVFDSFWVRHQRARADLRALRLPGHRPRR